MTAHPVTLGLRFWLRRNLLCRWFHRSYRTPTMLTYKKLTGLAWYCAKCYDWKRVDQMNKVLDSHPPRS